MDLDISNIKKIALSHGHSDHYMGMTELLNNLDVLSEDKTWGKKITEKEVDSWVANLRIPLIAHPAAFRERWREKDDGTMAGPVLPPPIEEWKAAGAEIILSEEPYPLAPGCWTTGFVSRTSFEFYGRPKYLRYREGSELLVDDIEDDQAIVINIKGKGLVVLSGCAHSGIVNTVEHARQISKEERVHAVIGGFHLARAEEEEIQKTIDYFFEIKPELVVPGHCTGLKAISRFAQDLPDQFIEGVVGATYLF